LEESLWDFSTVQTNVASRYHPIEWIRNIFSTPIIPLITPPSIIHLRGDDSSVSLGVYLVAKSEHLPSRVAVEEVYVNSVRLGDLWDA
jgi:hypothetical protein